MASGARVTKVFAEEPGDEDRDSVLDSLGPVFLLAAFVLFVYWSSAKRGEGDTKDPAGGVERAEAAKTFAFEPRAPATPKVKRTKHRRNGASKRNGPTAAERHRHHSWFLKASLPSPDSEQFSMEDVKKAVAVVTGSARKVAGNGKGKSKVKRVRSDTDGQYYYVAEDLPDEKQAANKLAEINRRSQTLLQAVDESLDENRRVKAADGTDITDNMKQLVRRHYQKPTPYAEYHNPSDLTVGSNSDKGMMIETALRNKYDPSEWNSDNTLFRVHIHELAHSADFDYREDGEDGHGPVFKRLHQHLLGVAQNLGIYDCEEYQKSGRRFAGLVLQEQYCGNAPS